MQAESHEHVGDQVQRGVGPVVVAELRREEGFEQRCRRVDLARRALGQRQPFFAVASRAAEDSVDRIDESSGRVPGNSDTILWYASRFAG